MSNQRLAWLLVLAGCKSAPAPDLAPAPVAAKPAPALVAKAVGNKVELKDIPVRAKGVTDVRLAWSVPPGTSVNLEAPARVRWHSSDGLATAPRDLDVTGDAVRDGVPLQIELTGGPSASLSGVIKLVVCDDVNHAVCTPVVRDVQLFFSPVGTQGSVDVRVGLPSAK